MKEEAMISTRPVRLFTLSVAIGVLAVACGGGTQQAAQTPSPSSPSTPSQPAGLTLNGEKPNNHGSRSVVGEESEDVELDDNYFSPTELKGSPGQQFSVRLKNEGGTTHTFTIDEQNIDEELQPDEESTVSVTFPQSGTVIFYCRFHGGLGMFGGLSV
jgi:plastocyanin